jgi:putative restriction endonuclease
MQQVIPELGNSGMYLALIGPGSYLDFANPVPFNGPAGPVERGVLNEQGRISGRAQSAVRPVSPEDFNKIIELGFAEKASLLPRLDADMRTFELDEQQQAPFRFEQQRDRINLTVSRSYAIEFSVELCCALMMSDARSPG